MYYRRRETTGTLKVILLLAVIFMAATSFLANAPVSPFTEWIPFDKANISIILAALCQAGLLCSTYLLGSLFLSNQTERFISILFTALLMFSASRGVEFSSLYPAAVCIVWIEYLFYVKSYFSCFFLLGVAALFFIPLVWLFPIMFLLLSIANFKDLLRGSLKAIFGFALPFILLFSVRFLLYSDIEEFTKIFLSYLSTNTLAIFNKTLLTLILLVFMGLICLKAVIKALAALPRLSNTERYIYRLHSAYIISLVLFYVIFAEAATLPLLVLICAPLGILFAKYFSAADTPALRIEWIILVALVILERIEAVFM